MRLFFLKSQKVRSVLYFFPVQLLILLFKRNHVLLIFWAIVFGFITKSIAPRYGIPYLFLNPEYFDKVSPLSYFIIGFNTEAIYWYPYPVKYAFHPAQPSAGNKATR